MYLMVLLLPLFSFLILGCFGFLIGFKGSSILSTVFIGIALLVSLFIFYEVGFCGTVVEFNLCDWFSIFNCYISWGFLFDTLTSVMLIVVTSISFLVHLYSTSYMEEDPHLIRFMSYLSLFTFFMLCLVTGNNFLQLFLGWEGVGVSSYLLINFWFTRLQANKAAIKAIIVNRFGDFGLLLSLVTIFLVFKSFNFSVIFILVNFFSNYYIPIFSYELHALTVISFFLLIGAIGKSAQLGLHTWLPDAMEGPTPVSALIHAATMVTAGIFVVVRTSIIFDYSATCLVFVVFIGALTAFFAGTIGIFQNDLKRVIAYSTCSQLGYMLFACGLSNYSVAMFHLMNHAFFKALLFLSAGSVIHALLDEQDMRRMGGLLKLLPFTFIMFIIGSLALMGFPFTTGYYSKDLILELAYSNYYIEGIFSYWLGLLGAGCTAFYSYRLLYYTFFSEINVSQSSIKYVHDAPIRMSIPLFVLGIGSIFVGYLFKDLFVGIGTNFWGNSLGTYNFMGELLLLEAEFIFVGVKVFPIFLSIFSSICAVILYEYGSKMSYKSIVEYNYIYQIYCFFSRKWYFDQLYNYYIVYPFLHFGHKVSFMMLDRGIIELVGPTGLVRLTQIILLNLKKLHSGLLFNYIFGMVFCLFFLIFFVGFAGLIQQVCFDIIGLLLIFGVVLNGILFSVK